jgi:LmbE family N-acetylglucosaminyl deacetylase
VGKARAEFEACQSLSQPRHLLRELMLRRSVQLRDPDLAQSAIVFSPHYDDETLGCGGTILKKTRLGAEMAIVFMTDGSKSHRDWMEEAELSRLRSAEGRAAAAALGVGGDDVIELDFEETHLADHVDSARAVVEELLRQRRPAEVFVPYRYELLSDHLATRQVVLSSIAQCDIEITVYEYPIWTWHRWPWTSGDAARRRLRGLFHDLVSANVRLMRDLRYRVYIGDVLDSKELALCKYRSQTARMRDQPSWPILGDVADGQFLKCFFQPNEYFARL